MKKFEYCVHSESHCTISDHNLWSYHSTNRVENGGICVGILTIMVLHDRLWKSFTIQIHQTVKDLEISSSKCTKISLNVKIGIYTQSFIIKSIVKY